MTADNVGIHEAKTQFSKLIENVKKGRRITITQRGRPVAVLAPITEHGEVESKRLVAISNIRNFRKLQKPVNPDEFEQLLKADQK